MHANVVSRVGDDLGLVQRHPVLYTVAEPPRHEVRVRREVIGDRARGPATLVLQRLWEIPVVEGDERTDPVREQLIDQSVVERDALLVRRTGARREHARPADGEAVGPEPELVHERDVLTPAVVVVARGLARLAGGARAWPKAERVPDGWPFAVGVVATLDLVVGGCRPEEGPGRKTARERWDLAHRGGSASSHASPMRALMPPST